jgi:hypothetical protein
MVWRLSCELPQIIFLIRASAHILSMYLKVHRSTDGSTVVAVCDRELLDRKLRQGDLELHVSEYFYGTTPAEEGDVTRAIQDGDHINLVGEQAVGVAIGLGLLERSGCMVIDGVPHAQIIRI